MFDLAESANRLLGVVAEQLQYESELVLEGTNEGTQVAGLDGDKTIGEYLDEYEDAHE